MRSLQQNLPELDRLGIRLLAISVDAPEVSRDLARKAGYTFPLLADPRAEVIRRYDLLHPAGSTQGQDIARPAEFLLDRNGVVRWRNLTDDYRVRARVEEVLAQARAMR